MEDDKFYIVDNPRSAEWCTILSIWLLSHVSQECAQEHCQEVIDLVFGSTEAYTEAITLLNEEIQDHRLFVDNLSHTTFLFKELKKFYDATFNETNTTIH